MQGIPGYRSQLGSMPEILWPPFMSEGTRGVVFYSVLGEWLILYHEVLWANSLQKLELSRLGKHSFGDGEVFFVIVLGHLVLDDTNKLVSYDYQPWVRYNHISKHTSRNHSGDFDLIHG
jgi:hypothetical protein